MTLLGKVDEHRPEVMGVVPQRRLIKARQRPDGGTGSGQEQDSERYLPAQEHVMQSAAPPAFRGSRSGFHAWRRTGSRERQRRRETKEQSGEERDARAEEQDRQTRLNVL